MLGRIMIGIVIGFILGLSMILTKAFSEESEKKTIIKVWEAILILSIMTFVLSSIVYGGIYGIIAIGEIIIGYVIIMYIFEK